MQGCYNPATFIAFPTYFEIPDHCQVPQTEQNLEVHIVTTRILRLSISRGMAATLKLLKLTGYVMHHQFNSQ